MATFPVPGAWHQDRQTLLMVIHRVGYLSLVAHHEWRRGIALTNKYRSEADNHIVCTILADGKVSRVLERV